MKAFLFRFAAFSVFLLVVLELAFRTLLPAAREPATIQIGEYGILAMDRSQGESGAKTLGRFCRPAYRWHINNDGFNSSIDYLPADRRGKPCAVVIGNSYALGLYGDVDETLAARLDAGLGDGMDVYNLAVSGMPLSQVPLVARFAAERYDPALIIIQCSARSVAGSLKSTGSNPYNRQYVLEDSALKRKQPASFTPNRYKHILLESALLRYLLYNANYNVFGGGLEQDAGDRPQAAAANDSTETLILEETFRDIAKAAPGARVLVVLDADRAAMYGAAKEPARLPDSDGLARACRNRGYDFLDLTDAFWNAYRRDGRKFDFEDNYHWNPYGVGVVANAVLGELAGMGILPDRATAMGEPVGGGAAYSGTAK